MRNFEEIIVTYYPDHMIPYPEYKGKPYFSIQYEENGEHHVGYGTFSPQVLSGYIKDYFNGRASIVEALENQKTGHWIELGCVGNDNYDFKCSECNHSDTHSKAVKVNYCWFCGAKME